MRVVTRNDGRCLDVVASPSSSYLLPDLSDFSLVKREARPVGIGRITLHGNRVKIDNIIDPEREANPGLIQPASPLGGWQLLIQAAHPPAFGVRGKLSMTDIAGIATGALVPRPRSSPKPLHTAVDKLAPEQSLAADAPVSAITTRIAALAELGDEKLAKLFGVERETYCRWRTGALPNPRPGNRRRLSLLLALLDELATRRVGIRDWMLNYTTPEGLTPYQLIERGRIDDAAYIASAIGESPATRDPQATLGRDRDGLAFGEDDVWEPDVDDDER